jgi:NAD(P)-dependent dehydrogenase (short-subunit alcohol dehydrogenase family)
MTAKAGSKLAAALVTGGGSGLGRATALRLAASGRYGVVIADVKNEHPLPKNVIFAQTDVSAAACTDMQCISCTCCCCRSWFSIN